MRIVALTLAGFLATTLAGAQTSYPVKPIQLVVSAAPGAATSEPGTALPREILLFQANLERYASGREELVDQIEATLLQPTKPATRAFLEAANTLSQASMAAYGAPRTVTGTLRVDF